MLSAASCCSATGASRTCSNELSTCCHCSSDSATELQNCSIVGYPTRNSFLGATGVGCCECPCLAVLKLWRSAARKLLILGVVRSETDCGKCSKLVPRRSTGASENTATYCAPGVHMAYAAVCGSYEVVIAAVIHLTTYVICCQGPFEPTYSAATVTPNGCELHPEFWV